MKKIINFLLIILMFVFFAPAKRVNAASLSTPVVINYKVEQTNDKTFTLNVYLQQNYGLVDLIIFLDYDQSAFEITSTSRTKATALKNLDYIPSGTLSTFPYGMSWNSDHKFQETGRYVNDNTNGLLISVNFKLKDGAADGEYQIKLVQNQQFRDSDNTPIENQCVYYNGNTAQEADTDLLMNKNIISDFVKVEIGGDTINDLTVVETKKDSNPYLWIVIPTSSLFIIATVFMYIKKKKDKIASGKWIKLK